MKSIFKKIAFVLAIAMVVTMLPAKAVSAASSDGPQMYSTLRLYLNSGNGITENSDLTGNLTSERYAKVYNWRESGYTSVAFESADPAIATVSSKGKVTAVKVGSTVVTATFADDNGKTLTKECKVTVKRNAAKVGLSADSAKQVEAGFAVGQKLQLTAVRKDIDGKTEWNKTQKVYTTDSVRFKSSNEDVFKVTKTTGMLTATGAGEATLTIWAVQSEGKDAETGEYPAGAKKEYKVVVSSFSATPTAVKEITVTGAFTKDSEFAVKKGNTNVAIAEKKISEDGKSAVLTLGGKLTNGTYTVSCGDNSASFIAEDQRVEKIVVLEDGGQVTVNPGNEAKNEIARTKFYVHYDVIDQYGQSVRKSFDVQWTSSNGKLAKDNKSLGLLTFEGSADSAGKLQPINYGSTIILTGIHTSGTNVKTVNASMVAGRENHVASVEFVGITKEFSSKIEQELPADFSNGDYLLLFNMLDILGYSMDYSDEEALNLNFISTDPFMLGAFDTGISIKGFVADGVTIDGETYGAIRLTRGINTSKGGTGKVQVTSTKVGQSTIIEFKIVAVQVLNTFQMYTPDEIIAEGDGTIAIPFEAYDTEGQPITSYRALCNALTFSDKALRIVENNDGSAWLCYSIPENAGASKYVDATRIYTSTVIKTGNVSTLTLTIKDEAVPTSVKSFGKDVATAAVEGYVQDVYASGDHGLVWYDQYDRDLNAMKYWNILGTRFYGNYAAVKRNPNATSITFDVVGKREQGTDESNADYAAYVARYNAIVALNDTTTTVGKPANYDANYFYFNDEFPVVIKFSDSCTLEVLQETLEFVLAEKDGKIVGGSDKKLGMKVVDLSKCVTLNFGTWGGKLKVYEDDASDANTGFWIGGQLSDGTNVAIPERNQAGYAYVVYSVDYTGKSLAPLYTEGSAEIVSRWPANDAKVGTIVQQTIDDAVQNVTVVSGAAIMNGTKATGFDVEDDLFKDQSKKLPDGTYAHRFLEATGVAKFYTLEPDGKGNFVSALKDVCKTNLYVGIQERRAASFKTAWWVNDKNEATINATAGKLTYSNLISAIDKYVDNYDNDSHSVNASTGVQITVSKLTESPNGVHFGSTVNVDDANKHLDMGAMSIVSNNTTSAGATMIQNAEIGDTFVATYEYEDAVIAITFTVGADNTASFNLATDDTTWR